MILHQTRLSYSPCCSFLFSRKPPRTDKSLDLPKGGAGRSFARAKGKHYPLEFRRFKKREQCEATGETFLDHTKLFCELVDWVCTREIPGDFTFDSYFTNAENLNHIHSKKNGQGWSRGYVGDLKTNRKLEWKGKTLRADAMAATIPSEDRKELRRGDTRQWYFTCAVKISKVNHKVRVVIIWCHWLSERVTRNDHPRSSTANGA